MDQLLSIGRGRDSVLEETMERIRRVFADLHLDGGGQVPSHAEMLDAAASLDSIAVLEFMAAVEKEFGIQLEPAAIEFEFLRDVVALAAYIEDRIKRPSDIGTDEPHGISE
jgi:acyl carrier protein